MDPWLFKLGRLGLAYRGVVSVRGFRKVRGRIWWRVGRDPLRMPIDPAPDLEVDHDIGKRPLHWAPTAVFYAGGGQPACGADPLHHLTTTEPGAVRGCPTCRIMAEASVMRRMLNVR